MLCCLSCRLHILALKTQAKHPLCCAVIGFMSISFFCREKGRCQTGESTIRGVVKSTGAEITPTRSSHWIKNRKVWRDEGLPGTGGSKKTEEWQVLLTRRNLHTETIGMKVPLDCKKPSRNSCPLHRQQTSFGDFTQINMFSYRPRETLDTEYYVQDHRKPLYNFRYTLTTRGKNIYGKKPCD